jgi:opacity protein-like surface antigen
MTWSCKLCLYSLLIVTFSFNAEAYNPSFHLKVEAPIAETGWGNEAKLKKADFSKVFHNGIVPSFGAGYRVSEFFEMELLYGTQRYNFIAYGINQEQLTFSSKEQLFSRQPSSPNLSKDLYTSARPVRGPNDEYEGYTCYATKVFTLEELCGTCIIPSVTYNALSSNILIAQIYGRLHTVLASGRVKPFKELGMFSPYLSVGVGTAHSRSKFAKLYYTSGSLSDFSSGARKTNSIAFEFGIGTQMRLAKNVSLDVAAKYFDYGKHTMAPNISRKINGYKITAGAMVKFPIKNRGAVANKAQHHLAHTNRNDEPSRAYYHPPEYNGTEENFIREQTIAEGERKAAIAIAKKMLKLGIDEANVATVTGLSLADLDKLK